ncbi:hypothetical protein MCUN1_000793 [Malassezia cuniculi]|uniref:Uncharacterized protein n=1 Tax=Malassezia cuniculi TaxID=948313 RepID=A0AAF0ERS0_9BASI|nr:hypothetical protein MCUN1_000793 [Malassezia cuniculi]
MHPNLVSFEELPPWARDNPLITSGYRRPGDPMYSETQDTAAIPPGLRRRTSGVADKPVSAPVFCHDTAAKCWQSVWSYWHNETVNIHTHLWGSVLAFVLLSAHVLDMLGLLPWGHVLHSATVDDLPLGPRLAKLARVIPLHHSAPPDWQDIVGFGIFLASAAVCLGCSATYHTMSCHSRETARSYNRLDYLGIVVLICGSGIPMLRYLFMCHPRLYTGYLVLSLTLGAAALAVVLQTKSQTSVYRPIRTAIFVALGLSGVFPMLHAVSLYETHLVFESLGMRQVAVSGALYIFGAVLYATRTPERFAPGKFNYIGSSHQIFHCFVLAGAWYHYRAVCRAYHFWHTVETIGGHVGERAICFMLNHHF